MTQDPVLAALARLEEGQKQLREQLGLVAHDQAVLFDALSRLPSRIDGLKIAMAPTLERLDRLDVLLRGLATRCVSSRRDPSAPSSAGHPCRARRLCRADAAAALSREAGHAPRPAAHTRQGPNRRAVQPGAGVSCSHCSERGTRWPRAPGAEQRCAARQSRPRGEGVVVPRLR